MRLFQHPLGWLLALVIAGSLISVFLNVKKQREISSFLSSVGFIIGMLGATAVGLYPWLLFSTLDPAYSLSVDNASAGSVGLRVGLIWWPIAMVLAVGYFVYLFRSFRGKVKLTSENHYP
jgi:cytochrome d ubiquinol oxidase subunit II